MTIPTSILKTVIDIVEAAPEVVPGIGRLIGHLWSGDRDAAGLEARLVAETITIKRAARAPFGG